MSEIIDNVEVNFSFGNEPHSATVSSVEAQFVCGQAGLGEIVGDIGEPSSFSLEKLDQFLKGFVQVSVEKVKTPTTIKRVRKYKDRLSAKLDSWQVLTRGSQTSPIEEGAGAYEYEGPVFSASELPADAFDTAVNLARISKTAISNYVDTENRIIVIGKTYSVISDSRRVALSISADGWEKIYHVYHKQQLNTDMSIGGTAPAYEPEHSKASLVYGYTPKQFFDSLTEAGIELDQESIETIKNEERFIFEVAGTIRSCLSAVANFFGYYWYSNNGKISFVSSAIASALQVEDYTQSADESILEASYTEDATTQRIVGCLHGSTKRIDGDGGFDEWLSNRMRRPFYKVPLEKIADKREGALAALKATFLFFNSDAAGNSDVFDKLFYYHLHYSGLEDEDNKRLYTPKQKGEFLKPDSNIVFGEDAVNAFKRTMEYLDIDANEVKALNLTDSEPDNKGRFVKIEKPSTVVMSPLRSFIELVKSLYVSHGYSEYLSARLKFSDPKGSILGPFASNKKLSDIPELSNLYEALQFFSSTQDITVRQVADAVNKVNPDQKKVRVSDPENPNSVLYHYFLVTELVEPEKVDIRSFEGMQFVTKNSQIEYLLCDTSGNTFIKQSEAKFATFAKERIPDKILVTSERSQPADEEKDESENEGGSGGGSGEVDYPQFELNYYKVIPQKATDLTTSELKEYSKSTNEAKILAANFESLFNSTPAKRSSVTYYDFVLPDEIDLTLDTVSIRRTSDGVSTTLSYSNKAFLPPSESILLLDKQAITTSSDSKRLSAGRKNFLGL